MLSSALLDRLKATWRTAGAKIADTLIPPLSGLEISETLAGTELALPPEAKLWWETLNVEPHEQQRQMTAGWEFLRLAEALEDARAKVTDEREIARAGDSDTPYLWVSTWLPFAWSDGRLLAVDCGPGASATSPVFYAGDQEIGPAKTCSMGEAVNWWIDGFESGGYYVHAESRRLRIRFDLLPEERRTTNVA